MIDYTNTILFSLGLLGVLLHILVELNKINRATNGNIKILQYLKLEVFSILISAIVVIVSILVKKEITQLEVVGKWLGLGFIAIGYMGQSLLVFVIGKAHSVIHKDNTGTTTTDVTTPEL